MTLPRIRIAIASAWLSSALLGCQAGDEAKTTASPPAATAKPIEPFQIRPASEPGQDVRTIFDELRLEIFAYDLKAPLNHRASFWMEVWRDGKLDEKLSEGHLIQPPRERPLFGRVIVSFMAGDSINAAKSRWSTRMESYNEERTDDHIPGGRNTSGQIRWVDDPFHGNGITNRSGHTFSLPTPIERGRTYTLRALVGGRGQEASPTEGVDTAEFARTVPLAIFFRARIERVSTDRLKDWSELGSTSVPPDPLEE